MPVDQNYVQSMEAWFKSMGLNIQQTKNSIEFNQKEIELHQKHIEVDDMQLQHDEARLETARKRFADYLEANKE